MKHPLLVAMTEVSDALKSVGDVNPTFMSPDDKAGVLRDLVRIQGQVAELKLRVLAAAGDVAEQTGHRDPASWLAHQTRTRLDATRADQDLAEALDRRYHRLARALRDGQTTLDQTHVIARALDALPAEFPAETVELAEAALVAYAAEFGPRELARLGHRVLDVVAPHLAEQAEARRLADLEADAKRKTRLTLRRLGDGTTQLSGLLPDASATRLATYLEAFANPRRADDPTPAVQRDPVARLAYPHRLGDAFCHLLETLDPGRLPIHGGDATTVIVTVPLESLRHELGVADLFGSDLPGDDATGDRISATEVRRLACNAHLIPAVLGSEGEVLDLGRSQRLFNRAQRKALLLRDRHCRAEGCDLPGTWSEAHHWAPWSQGGATDLDNAVLLCRHHHQRVHDTGYRAERLASGDVRFHRRR